MQVLVDLDVDRHPDVLRQLLDQVALVRGERPRKPRVDLTSVAAICSPPFLPMVAASLGSRSAIGPGIITGIIGWVVGTYCGIGLALLLGAVV